MKKIVLNLLTITLIIANGMHASAGAHAIEQARKEEEASSLNIPTEIEQKNAEDFLKWIQENPKYVDANGLLNFLMDRFFRVDDPEIWFPVMKFVIENRSEKNIEKELRSLFIWALHTTPYPLLERVVDILIERGIDAQKLLDTLNRAQNPKQENLRYKIRKKLEDVITQQALEEAGKIVSEQTSCSDIEKIFKPSNPHLLAIKHAIEDEDLAALTKALENNAWLELQDATGYTPLLYAAYLGKREAIRYLIEQGANIDAKTKDGATVNDFGNYANLILEARAERERLQKNKKDTHEAQIAHYSQRLFKELAANDDTIDQTIRLAESFPEAINQQDAQGRTPLMVAATAGNQQAVSALLNAHVNTALTDNEGYTALQRAITEGHYAIANLIIAKMDKQGLQIRNQNGFTAYDLAMLRVEPDKDRAEALAMLVETMKAMMQ